MVETIDDIKTENEKYNFTDGVGQISSDLNLRVRQLIINFSLLSFSLDTRRTRCQCRRRWLHF